MTPPRSGKLSDPRFGDVLVTGGTGFLGRVVVAALRERGYRVTAASRAAVDRDALAADLADEEAAAAALTPWRWSAVVNLAGPVPASGRSRPPADDPSQHEAIARNLSAAIPSGWTGRLIHASSMTVYGIPTHLPVRETAPRAPVDAYATAKCRAEDALVEWAAARNGDLWLLRFPGLFSEERTSGALYHFLQAAGEGRSLRISAPVRTAWEILHVGDAAAAIVAALGATTSAAGPLNVGYGTPMSLHTVADYITRKCGLARSPETLAGVEHPLFALDVAKIRALLPWPPSSLEQRLDEFIASAAEAPVGGGSAR